MELQDFVTETLKQIITGVKEATVHAKESGAELNPTNLTWSGGDTRIITHISNGAIVQNIEFDIAVTTTDSSKSKGGVGVFVGAVGIGTSAQSQEENTSLSRIKFSVPLSLPSP